MKRLISTVLTVAMLISSVPFSAVAKEEQKNFQPITTNTAVSALQTNPLETVLNEKSNGQNISLFSSDDTVTESADTESLQESVIDVENETITEDSVDCENCDIHCTDCSCEDCNREECMHEECTQTECENGQCEDWNTEENYAPEGWGTETTVDNTVYYIEDGNLLCSVDSGRPETVNTDVKWLIQRAGTVYYAKIDGNNTDIYKKVLSEGSDFDVFTRLFVPVDCFDVQGDEVYYLWNGEIEKVNATTGEEVFVQMFDCDAFWIENGIFYTINTNVDCKEKIDDGENGLFATTKNGHQYYQQKESNWSNISSLCYLTSIAMLISDNGYPVTPYDVYVANGKSASTNWKTISTTYGVSIQETNVKGSDSEKKEQIKKVLNSRANPYGVMVTLNYAAGKYHMIVARKVVNDIIYFDDPGTYGGDRGCCITLENCYGGSWKNVISYRTLCPNSNFVGKKCENCKKAWTSSFQCNADGACTSCGSTYGYSYEGNSCKGVYKPNGTNNYKKLYLREKPYESATLLKDAKFKKIYVYNSVKNAKGHIWYYCKVDSKEGYIVANKIQSDYSIDPNEKIQGNITLVNEKFPSGERTQGRSFDLEGTINSTEVLSKVTGRIVDAYGNIVQSIESYPNSTQLNIKSNTINRNLKFGKLSTGVYCVEYVAEDANGYTKTFKSDYFTIGNVVVPPSIKEEAIKGGVKISISCSDGSTQLYYTLNGSSQKSISNGGSFNVKKFGNYYIEAWSIKNGTKSVVKSYSFMISKSNMALIQQMTTDGYLFATDIDIRYDEKCAYAVISGEGEIHYTLDGSEPSEYSPTYTEQIRLTESCTVKAIAIEYGYSESDVTTKDIIIKEPDPPVIALYNTKDKIAQGKTATVSWEKVKYSTSYKAYLYLGDELIDSVTTTGTSASFPLNKRSDTENFTYSIKVVATNFVGDSGFSNTVNVTAMHPLNVTFVDKVNLSSSFTEEDLREVKRRIDNHDGDGASSYVEGNVISVQKVDYDEKPSKPSTPSKKGFDFAGWSQELYEVTTVDKTVYAEFDIKYYTVKIFDRDSDFGRGKQLNAENQKYMFTSEVEFPTDYFIQDGYVLAGWTIDAVNSDGTDYSYVDGDMQIDATYKWENEALPVIMKITKLERDDNCYRVVVNLKNFNLNETQGRLIVSLYTSTGRNVKNQIAERDLDLGNYTDYKDAPEITILYTKKIAYAKAYLVAIDPDTDRTLGTLAEAAEYSNITYREDSGFYTKKYYWTDWTGWSTTPVTASDTVEVNTKVQYRYSDKQYTTTNNTKSLSGWNYWYTDSHVGGWNYNGTNWVGEENNDYRRREVSANWVPATYKTIHRYWGYYAGGSKWHFCPRYYGGWEVSSGWIDYEIPFSAWSTWQRCSCGDVCYGRYIQNGNYYYWHETGSQQTGGGYYTYNYKDTYYTHHFWKWGGWSGWYDYYIGGSDTRQTQARTLYQYRVKKDYNEFNAKENDNEEPDVYTHDDVPFTGNLNCGDVEYITEEKYNSGDYSLISGPYYKTDDGEYVLVDESNHDVKEYRFGRYTNGSYTMPCLETAEETYGGEWSLEWTDWSEKAADEVNENVYSCENIEHIHNNSTQQDNINYWNEYVLNGESYCFMEEKTVNKEVTYSDKNKYYLVNVNFENQVATVLIYKKTNTDPTQGQLEYVEQVKIGKNNSYEFGINTKELIEYGLTDDFIVALSLEGGKRLLNVDLIKAVKPQYNVRFYISDGEEYYTKTVDEGDSIDVNEVGIPTRDGYRFVKWDKSIVNVTENIDVNAIWEPIKCTIVFVDHENETTEMKEVNYGDPIESPDVEAVQGMTFLGWDNQSYRYVTESVANSGGLTIVDGPYYKNNDGNYVPVSENETSDILDGTKYYRVSQEEIPTAKESTVITAMWDANIYTVKFCDFDGNVISTQQVKYGSAAMPPACIEGCPWNTNSQTWWNVTEDMTIYPYKYNTNSVIAPASDTASGEYDDSQLIILETQEDTPIYYSVNVEISDEDAHEYIDSKENSISLLSEDGEVVEEEMGINDYIQEYTTPILVDNSSIIYAFTVKDGEISPISVYEYEINDDGIDESTEELDTEMAQITVPNLVVKPGDTVEVPISIKNNPGVTNLSIIMNYDSANLTLEDVKNGNVFNNTEFSNDVRDDGSCKFTWISKSINSNNGTLATLVFKAGNSAKKAKVELDIDGVECPTEEEQPFATQDGVIKNVGEDVYYGDVNGDKVADFADAIILIRYDIGLATLTDEQKKFADVNGDGDVDFADAIKIMRFDAGFISSLK